jgi:hypothetical protein
VLLSDAEAIAAACTKRAEKAGEEEIASNMQVALDAIIESLSLIEDTETDYQATIDDFVNSTRF